MFPHMYKVRPGKSQQVKSPSDMSADCEKWQADSWRRNSQKWGSQGWEGGPPSPASSIPQTPPPIPAPPPDPQDNLTKKASVTLVLKEPPAKKEATGSSRSTANEDACNNSTTEKETKYWWEMDDEETDEGAKLEDENKVNGEVEYKEEVEEEVVDYWTCKEDQEDSATPWRRSRSRTSSPPKMELDAPPTGRRRSRNVMRDLNCPTGDTGRNSTSPPSRRRSRPPTDESQSFTERSSSIPGRRRKRNNENEVPNGTPQTEESEQSTSPPIRRRTREPSSEVLNGTPQTQESERSTSPPIRRRTREPSSEVPNETPQTQESERSTSPPIRRRTREPSTEVSNGTSQTQESERSTSPPIRRRTREPSTESDFANENYINEVIVHPIRRRSRPRALQTEENSGPGTQDVSNEGNNNIAITRQSRSRALQTEENQTITPENNQVTSTAPVARRRSTTADQQDNHENEPQQQNSSSSPLRIRVRNPSTDTNSASDYVAEVVLSLPPRRRRPPVLVDDERKGQEAVAQKQRAEPQMVVGTFKGNVQEGSPEPELCRSTLQVELKIPVNDAQGNSEVSSSDACNREPFQVEESTVGTAATVVIRKRPISTNATNDDQVKINFEKREKGDKCRKRSGPHTEIQNQIETTTEEPDDKPTTTAVVRRRPTSSHSASEDQMKILSEERNGSVISCSGRVDANSENEKDDPKSNVIVDEEPTTATVRIRRRPSSINTDEVELSPNLVIVTSDIKSAIENEEPVQNIGSDEVPTENELMHTRSVTLSTGNIDQEMNTSQNSINRRRHSESISFKDDRDDKSTKSTDNNRRRRHSEAIPFTDDRDDKSTESTDNNHRRRPDNEINISDDVVEYVYENDKPKDEEVDWTHEKQNTEDSNIDADGWSNCDMVAEEEDHVVLQPNDEQEKDTEVMEVEKDEEDEVANATRIWLASQQALLAPPKPMKIIYLTEEELKFDPLQQVKEEEKVRCNSDYDTWDAEPADQEPTPEFLKKKLKKVETQTSLTPLKIDRERSPVSPVFSRRRRGSSPTHDQADEKEVRASARSRRSRAADGTNHEEKVQETAPISEVPKPPPPPPPPPPAPKASKVPLPPPPPPLSKKEKGLKKAREEMVDQIKKAARTRPDWHSVMKDIEGGIKLRKVGNDMKADRSMPILPSSRGKGGKFVYESEKPMMHNEMLEEIQRGVRLRHVRTNDRSRPDFNKLGIRKLRRQVTTEEKKTVDPDTPEALPSSSDEEEDIDQMRDDLQSTKTQLSEEIKKTKQIERENKILKIDIESLQAEVKRMKRRLKEAGIHEAKPLANGEADAIAPKLSKSMSKLRMREEDLDFSELDNIEEDIKILNEQIEAQRKRAEQAEQKCEELTQKMKVAENSTDEWELRSIYFEKKFKALQKDQGIELPDINCIGIQTETVEISDPDSPNALPTKKSLSRKSFGKLNRMESFKEEEEDSEESSSEEEESLSEHIDGDEEDGHNDMDSEREEDDDARAERQAENESIKRERELKLWQNKLGHAKEKMKNVKRERNNLRDRIKKYYKDMRKEREEYLKVKAELRDLAEQMKDEESLVDDSYEETDDSENDSLSENEGTPKKPKKLKKRKKRKIISEDKQEEILHNDEPDDLYDLVDPEWSASEDSESEQDNEDDDIKNRIKRLKEKIERKEQLLNDKKKDNYILKSQIDRCDEQYGEERRRNARINTELQFLFADI